MTHLLNTPVVGNIVAWQDLSREVINCETQSGDCLKCLLPALQKRGYRVTALPTEKAVLQTLLDEVPDLLIICLQTSGREGYDFCEVLRKLPRTKSLPVAFVGTRDTALELITALRCGGDEYIQLPTTAEELWLRLERHLRKVHLMRHLEAEKASLHQKIWSYNTILRQQEEVQASLAKENQTLQRLAFTDGLTRVANRSSFNETLPKIWQTAAETRQPVSLLLCDIDYFKHYNDTYGHPAGDACLRAVADVLVRATHRQDDQVARYGGEEFAILLPGTDASGAQQVAMAAHSELARAQIPHQASLVKPFVSLSIGICTLTPNDPQYESLLHGADEALYTAKLRGRDRSVANTAQGLISIPAVPDGSVDSVPARPRGVKPSVARPIFAKSAVAKPVVPVAVGLG
ncbi:MAG: diguanylate cyclase [Cyanobacteria bacterium P01_D01_bin.105]